MEEDDHYLDAFWELSTNRQIGMAVGPIPSDSIRNFARDHGFESDVAELFRVVMRAMDEVYMTWMKEEADNQRKESGGR